MPSSPKSRLFWLYWFPVIGYCAVIFIQSSYPPPDSLPVFPFADKVFHFFAYALLGGLFSRAFSKTDSRWGPVRIIVFSVAATTLYGVGDEIHQSFVDSRMMEAMDVVADFAGGVFGALGLQAARLFNGRTWGWKGIKTQRHRGTKAKSRKGTEAQRHRV